jgi:hypothetical protein
LWVPATRQYEKGDTGMSDNTREWRARRLTAFALPITIAVVMLLGSALAPAASDPYAATNIALAQPDAPGGAEPGVQVDATATGEVADVTPGPSGQGGIGATGGSGGGSDLTGNPGSSGGTGNSSITEQGNPGNPANRTDNPQQFPWWALLIPVVLIVVLALFFMRPRAAAPADARYNAPRDESDPSANSGTGDTGTTR